jgi:hypothetical protein
LEVVLKDSSIHKLTKELGKEVDAKIRSFNETAKPFTKSDRKLYDMFQLFKEIEADVRAGCQENYGDFMRDKQNRTLLENLRMEVKVMDEENTKKQNLKKNVKKELQFTSQNPSENPSQPEACQNCKSKKKNRKRHAPDQCNYKTLLGKKETQ